MSVKQSILFCTVLMGVMIAAGTMAGDPAKEAEKQAIQAAESWLGLVDAGEYDKSWEQAAELFRAAVSKEQWRQSLTAVRTPLGELQTRKVTSATYATSLPGAPDGEYVVIQFSSSFAKKKSAVETVTPMKDPDGVWRVSGYFIK